MPASATSSEIKRDNDWVVVYKENDFSNPEGAMGSIIVIFSYLILVSTLPLSLLFVIRIVQEYERAVIFRLGRLLSDGARGPGVFFINPWVDRYEKIDMRTHCYVVPPQEILTEDSVTVHVNAVMYYKVVDPSKCVANVDDYSGSARLLAATTLRNILGTRQLGEILSDRKKIANEMQIILDELTDPWGVKVERVEVKDVRVPDKLQRSLAAEAEAARNSRAMVIGAEAEFGAAKMLKHALTHVDDSATLQLRYLQTLNQIAAEQKSLIVYPLPVDL